LHGSNNHAGHQKPGIAGFETVNGLENGSGQLVPPPLPLPQSGSRQSAVTVFGARTVETDILKGLIDFFKRFFAKIGNAQQVIAGRFQEVADRKYSFFFKTVGRSYGQTNLSGT
jgi:hypothetical protein